MLTRRADTSARFTRQDLPRVAIAAGILILALTAILGADILPEAPLDATVGQLATARHRRAARGRLRQHSPDRCGPRTRRANAVEPQYDFTSENAIAIAADQQLAFETRVAPIDTTFAADLSAEERAIAAQDAPSRT